MQTITLFNLPNSPLLRFVNYLQDGPFLQKRWITTAADTKLFKDALLIPGDRYAIKKTRDPNWRRRWRWVILKANCLDSFCPIIIDRELESRGQMMKLMFPLKTPIFALRVGPRSIRVMVKDTRGVVTAPSLFSLGKNLSDRAQLLRRVDLEITARTLQQNGYADLLEV